MNNRNILIKTIFACLFIILAASLRIQRYPGNNIELVTSVSLLAGAYLGFTESLFVPLMIMVISDAIIGNTNIFIFTWSGYIFIGYLSYLSNSGNSNGTTKILRASGLGIIASIWFFLWTNFGVWLLDSWGMYSKTIDGLLQAYWYGLPFLKNNLLGNILLVPLVFTCTEIIKRQFKTQKSKTYESCPKYV